MIWARLATFLASPLLKWGLTAAVLIISGWGIVSSFVPRSQYEELQERLDEAFSQLADAELREEALREEHAKKLQATMNLFREESRKNAILNKHFDQIREHQRLINEQEVNEWRAVPVPSPVVRGLRKLAPTGNED